MTWKAGLRGGLLFLVTCTGCEFFCPPKPQENQNLSQCLADLQQIGLEKEGYTVWTPRSENPPETYRWMTQVLNEVLEKGFPDYQGPVELRVVNAARVNAFTVGGGFIFVYEGLLSTLSTEAELAGILAHEVAHNLADHPKLDVENNPFLNNPIGDIDEMCERMKTIVRNAPPQRPPYHTVPPDLIQMEKKRAAEYVADEIGTERLFETNYDVQGFRDWLLFLNPISLSATQLLQSNCPHKPWLYEDQYATHPQPADRITNLDHYFLSHPEFQLNLANLNQGLEFIFQTDVWLRQAQSVLFQESHPEFLIDRIYEPESIYETDMCGDPIENTIPSQSKRLRNSRPLQWEQWPIPLETIQFE